MAYRFLTFDGIPLPTHMPLDDLSTPPSESAIVQALNGNVDVLGSSRSNARPQTLEYTGMYLFSEWLINDQGLLVDEFGDPVITEEYDFLVVDTANYYNFLEVWGQRRGMRSVLVRQAENGGTLHWKYARLSQFEYKRSVDQANQVARVRLVFELDDDRWLAMRPTIVTAALAASGSTNVSVTVASAMTIDDPTITISNNAGSANIDDIEITNGVNQHLVWTSLVSPYAYNPVPAGYSIVFDCGAFIVDGGLGYIGFSLHPLHTAQGWIEFMAGSNTLTVYIAGGPGTVELRYYEAVR